MMGLLSRDQILSADDLKTEDVDIPAWGGMVRVRTMTGKDRDAFGESLGVDANGNIDVTNYRAKLLAHCIIDESGNLLFSEADIVALGNKSASAIVTAFEVAERLNGTGSVTVKAIEKNSDAATSGDSTSASA